LYVVCCFCHDNPGLNFTCKSYVFCYHATQIFEIFHILQLFLIYRNLHCVVVFLFTLRQYYLFYDVCSLKIMARMDYL